MELYKTVRAEAEAEQIIEKSRFIAHVKPVVSKEDGDEFIDLIRKQYKDATHNVPAMVIGDKFQIQWASDDGEPQGTSGAPIGQMLVKEGITDIAVVVTRYFGGIKLGTGGLVRAYTSSTKLGLEAAGVCRVCEICFMKVKTDYTFLAKIQNLSVDRIDDREGFMVGKIQYSDKIIIDIMALPEYRNNVVLLLSNMTSGTAEILDEKIIKEKI